MQSRVTTLVIALTALLVACARAPDPRLQHQALLTTDEERSKTIGDPDSAGTAAAARVLVTPASITWESAPGLPPGAKRALLVGDPAKAGPFVARMQFPAGYRVAPHWHTGSENVTVISGTMSVGMGDAFDEATMQDLPAGSYYFVPPNTHHYVMTRTAVIGQVHGIGPLDRIFVNPADDPRTQKK